MKTFLCYIFIVKKFLSRILFFLAFLISFNLLADDFTFHPVKYPSHYFEEVAKHFQSNIQPLYGDQEVALNKIKTGKDRACEVLLNNKKEILGILVFKTQPTSEWTRNALEIKTLIVVNPKKNSGKGYGTKLIQRIYDVAKQNPVFQSITVTVSENVQESLIFFNKKGFKTLAVFNEKYKRGTKEYILIKDLNNL